MTFLLDTHVLLWLLADPGRIPDDIRADLANRANRLLVSAASALEISTKTRLGKLDGAGLVSAWARRIDEIGATQLPVTAEHALLAGSMAWPHRDPFDRILVAQAQHESAALVTVDGAMTALTTVRLVTWSSPHSR